MRKIHKQGTGGYHLEQANSNPPSTSKQATSRWKSFNHKDTLTDRLYEEQFDLCAYSEICPEDHDLGTHIEHVRPKSHYPHQTFDYHNLVLSALSDSDLASLIEAHYFGGHANAKRGAYDEALFISPLMPHCKDAFVYLSDGRIVPNYQQGPSVQRMAEYTIDLLNLNCEYLKGLRQEWIEELDQLIDQYREDTEQLNHLADVELGLTNGRLRSFHTAAQQRFGPVGRNIIQESYPELL
jgi:uncharacterized protein (TIGR02646 family)